MQRFSVLLIAIAAAAAAGGSAPAAAQTYSPAGSTIAVSGTLTVSKGVTLNCSVAGSGTISADGKSSAVNRLALTGGLCGVVTFVGLPYAIVATGPTTASLVNVQVTAVTGNCAGTLPATFNQSTGQIIINNAQLPSNPPGGSACKVNGTINTSPAASYTIP